MIAVEMWKALQDVVVTAFLKTSLQVASCEYRGRLLRIARKNFVGEILRTDTNSISAVYWNFLHSEVMSQRSGSQGQEAGRLKIELERIVGGCRRIYFFGLIGARMGTVLVTGASRGIGLELARQYVE